MEEELFSEAGFFFPYFSPFLGGTLPFGKRKGLPSEKTSAFSLSRTVVTLYWSPAFHVLIEIELPFPLSNSGLVSFFR